MKLDGGKSATNSIVGGLLSVLMIILLVLYAFQKGDVFIRKKDVDIVSTINENTFDSTHAFM